MSFIMLQGFHLHYATWQTAIHGFASAKELKPLRKKLFPERLPEMSPKLKSRFFAAILVKFCSLIN